MRFEIFAIILALFLFKCTFLFSDIPKKGHPFTQYYSPSDFRAGSNTYNVVRDSLGVFYFSNDEGVLLYDGIEWSLVPIKGNRPVFWVAIDHKGTVLVASSGEIGYLDHLPNGEKIYKSLMENSPNAEFDNVWEIATSSKESVFRSRKLIIHYQNGEINAIKKKEGIEYDVAFTVRDTIYLRKRKVGLFYVSNGDLIPVKGGEFFADIKLNIYLPFDNKLLVGSRSEGLFLMENGKVEPFLTEADEFLKKYKIYHGGITQSGDYAFSAYTKGVAIIDRDGKVLQLLDETSGLPRHQYLSVGAAGPSSLWITHAVGISRTEILSPISYFDKSFGLNEVVTNIKIHKGSFYFTTLDGFYQYQSEGNEFKKINDNYIDEFHSIAITNNQLFVGGLFGLMSFENGKLTELTKTSIYELSVSVNKRLIYAGGSEAGLYIIKNEKNNYQITSVKGFSEPVKKIIPFENSAFVVSEFGKLVLIKINYKGEKLEYKIEKKINFGDFDAFKIKNNLLVITQDNWILLNNKGEQILEGLLPISNKITKIQTISALKDNAFWISYKDENRVAYCEKWLYKDHNLISTTQKFKPGFKINSIFRGEDGVDWFGGDQGIIRYDTNISSQGKDPSIACYISSTILNNDSLVSRYGFKPEKIRLPYKGTSLLFNFYSDISFSSNDEVLFQYKLKGLDKDWSSWSTKSNKEYSNLNPKSYTFQVRAKNGLGKISEIDSLKFKILTPWYSSIYAFFTYGILIIMGGYTYTRWRTNILNKAKKQLEKLVEGRTIEVELQKQSLEEQGEILQQANDTKDQLFSIIGHDLRGPLNSIQGLTDLIKHYRAEKQPEKVDDLMGKMSSTVKGLSHLLDNLLSWALNQSGNFKIKKESIRLHFLVNEVIGVLNETAKAKNINLFVDVDMKLTLNADVNSLGTIIRNLISNAIKFTHKNGNVWINASSNNKIITIEIRDNGVGISKNEISKIFQLSNSSFGTSNEKGTGLGLVLVEGFVKLNCGKMTVKSKENEGSSFILTFPEVQ